MADPTQKLDPSSFIHVTAKQGHHGAYQQLFGALFGLSPSTGHIGLSLFLRLCRAKRLFFGTLDDDLKGFIAVALARTLLGRKTAGLFLHPNTCVGKGWRATVKRVLFSILRRVPKVGIISILPFDIMPGLDRVANAYVHDPQLWDQVDEEPTADPEAVRRLRGLARGRPILAYLGWATEAKAFPFLASIVTGSPGFSDEVLVVAAGRVTDACRTAATCLAAAGGIVWDRFVTDAELAALYSVSSLVWVCYAPGYDQASGIFGRSIQTGTRMVIRDGAITLGYYSELLDAPALVLPQDSAGAARILLAAASTQNSAQKVPTATLRRWKAEFIATGNAAMGSSGTQSVDIAVQAQKI